MDNTLTIVNGCKARDPKYQQIFYELYRAFALKVVYRYIYNYEEAREVSNDGFVKFFLSIDSFRYETAVSVENLVNSWLRRIMINTSIDLLRKKMLLPEIGGITDSHLDIPLDEESADQLAVYNDMIKLVKQLPPAYRIVFNMYVIDGYSHLQISESLNIPMSTSRSNLSRARNLLMKYLNQTEALVKCSM